MQGAPIDPSTPFVPIAIAVAVGVLSVAFAIVRRVQGSGDDEVTARRFPPRHTARPVLAVISALIAIGVGYVLLSDRSRGTPPLVLIGIGVLAFVSMLIAFVRMRDGDR